MTTTSKVVNGEKVTEFFINVKPAPASRPRISKYGNYYPKGYTDFRRQAYKFLQGLSKKFKAIDKVSFKVDIEIICAKPKSSSNKYPRGDIDNYLKSYLDSITYAQKFWADDIQVTELNSTKRYQEEGEEYGARITITQLSSS